MDAITKSFNQNPQKKGIWPIKTPDRNFYTLTKVFYIQKALMISNKNQ